MNKLDWWQLLELGRVSNSPLLIEQALQAAEKSFGNESAEVGLCLMELAEQLVLEGKLVEAERATFRYKLILCKLAQNLGLIDEQ